MYVYVIANADRRFKIGMAADPQSRLHQLQTGQPDRLQLVFSHETNKARDVERAAHTILELHRLTGEWFAVTQDIAVAAVLEAIRSVHELDGEWVEAGGWTLAQGDAVVCRRSFQIGFPEPLPVIGTWPNYQTRW